jgi:hypothetical protein
MRRALGALTPYETYDKVTKFSLETDSDPGDSGDEEELVEKLAEI